MAKPEDRNHSYLPSWGWGSCLSSPMLSTHPALKEVFQPWAHIRSTSAQPLSLLSSWMGLLSSFRSSFLTLSTATQPGEGGLSQRHTQVGGRAKLETGCLETSPLSFQQRGRWSPRVALPPPERSGMSTEKSVVSAGRNTCDSVPGRAGIFFFPSNEWGCQSHRIKLRTIYPKPVYATGVLWGAPVFEGWGAGSYEQLFAAAQWQDRSLQWPGWGASGDDHHPPSSWPQHTHNFVTQTQLSVLCCLASPLTILFPWSRVRYRIAVAWNRWPGCSGGQWTEQEVWHQETSSEPFLALSLT